MRGATVGDGLSVTQDGFQSTHPLRGATHVSRPVAVDRRISIHAPLAGCDMAASSYLAVSRYFNPRTPCGVRRAPPNRLPSPPFNFNPRTPCGVRRPRPGDQDHPERFQSTHPLRGATRRNRSNGSDNQHFNPRTPCGVRPRSRAPGIPRTNFNPRTPCGVRLSTISSRITFLIFQSTHPLRGATMAFYKRYYRALFQSTHPLRGATLAGVYCRIAQDDFNPRTPCGVRRSITSTTIARI